MEFLQSQWVVNELLGKELQSLRHGMNRLMARVGKAMQTVEHIADGNYLLYEVHKQELLGTLRDLNKDIQLRREDIMMDALRFEACRSLVRKFQEQASSLRCIEDFPQAKPSLWARVLAR